MGTGFGAKDVGSYTSLFLHHTRTRLTVVPSVTVLGSTAEKASLACAFVIPGASMLTSTLV